MKIDPRFNRAATGAAFIGHAGVGSQVLIKDEGRGFSIQQSAASQLWLILSLLAMIVVPTQVFIFERAKIRGTFSYFVLGIVAVIAVPFFIKYTFRFFGRRRVYVDPTLQKIYFYTSGTNSSVTHEFASIQSVKVETSVFRSEGTATDNFTVLLVDQASNRFELCTTDLETQAREIERRLASAMRIN
ncbi:hypothetical protein BH10BDE1_BH10BDE1_16560 [soil metagenome]